MDNQHALGAGGCFAHRTHVSAHPATLLELQALQRDAATNGWTPEAYLRIARWCHRHRPEATQFWTRLALEVAP